MNLRVFSPVQLIKCAPFYIFTFYRGISTKSELVDKIDSSNEYLLKRSINTSHKQQNHHKEQGEIAGQKKLLGKVVLLIGNDMAVIQTLVNQLARKGADVAILCWQMPLDIGRKIKESVHFVGRHFLLIEQAERNNSTNNQLIETITAELGQLYGQNWVVRNRGWVLVTTAVTLVAAVLAYIFVRGNLDSQEF